MNATENTFLKASRIIAYHARIYAPDGNLCVPYRDHYERLAIGFDHTRTTSENQSINQHEAQTLLHDDLTLLQQHIWELTENAVLSVHQMAAMLSFAHSMKLSDFKQTTVVARIRCRRLDDVGAEMQKHVTNGTRTLRTLTQRRVSEACLWGRV